MPYNPTLPVENTPLDAVEMRAQFQGLKAEIDNKVDGPYVDGAITAQAAGNCSGVTDFTIFISDPPQQAELQALADKLNELLGALRRV